VAEGRGHRGTMGETLPVLAGLRLKAGGRLPEGARLVLFRDGRRLAEAQSALDVEVPGAGVYRIEVRVEGSQLPWILSNPIYVFGAAMRATRERRAAWTARFKAPSAGTVIDDFEGKTTFQAAADSQSSVRREVLDPRGGTDGRGAARLEFRIGEPQPDHPDVFAALVDPTHRDLRGRSGLVFSVRADGVYRIWVQVRDENKAANDGTEWWFSSVRTSTEWQRVSLPFARMRSVTPRSDGRLDLDSVRALVFVVDRGSVKPGTSGTIWLDDLGVY
jgi:carbohydrate binding protein with CBM11 domain